MTVTPERKAHDAGGQLKQGNETPVPQKVAEPTGEAREQAATFVKKLTKVQRGAPPPRLPLLKKLRNGRVKPANRLPISCPRWDT